MNASRMRRPSGGAHRDVLQIGIGAREPPGHRRRLGVVGVHAPGARVDHARQLVGVGRLELGQRAVFEQGLGQRVIGGEPLQHLLVGGGRAARGLLQHRQLQALEEDFADLLGRIQVERLAGLAVGLVLQLHHLLPEFAALRLEQRARRSARRCAPCGTALRAPAARSAGRRIPARPRPAPCGYRHWCRRSVTSASSAEYSVARSTLTCSKPMRCAPLPVTSS